jgi:uncharacterized RmlC-like cupin family protein
MLRVSKAEGRRAWHRAADAARLGLRNHGECVIIRSSDALAREPLTGPDSNLPGGQPPVPHSNLPGGQPPVPHSNLPGGQPPVPHSNIPGGPPPAPPEGQPGEQAHVHPAGDEDCRRSGRDQRPGGSGPSSGTRALRLHLVLIRPGTRGLPHFHDGRETAVYMVSGEAEVWHGAGLDRRTVVRAGDFIYVPPGAPHLAVNRGDVTSIAVVARADPGDEAVEVTVELPRHLAALRGVPVGGA